MHVMIDLETLGTGPRAAIIQIGWCFFEPDGSEPISSGLVNVDPQSCLDAGLVATWDTIQWWLKQSEAARGSVTAAERVCLGDSLTILASNIDVHDRRTIKVWANSPAFDLVILETAYKACGIPVPWHFTSHLDYRTLLFLAPVTRVRPTVAHDARADAVAQAMTAQRALKVIAGSTSQSRF